jgi:hypothetical protein
MKKCSYCGKLNEDALTVCSGCCTTLPSERFDGKPAGVLTPTELRGRRKAFLGGVIWVVLSLGVLAMGWLYPVWFLGHDPIMQRDPDTRLGPAFLLCLIASFVFAVLAVRSFQPNQRTQRTPR